MSIHTGGPSLDQIASVQDLGILLHILSPPPSNMWDLSADRWHKCKIFTQPVLIPNAFRLQSV